MLAEARGRHLDGHLEVDGHLKLLNPEKPQRLKRVHKHRCPEPVKKTSAIFTPCIDHNLNLTSRFAERCFLNSRISTNKCSHPLHTHFQKKPITIPSASPSASPCSGFSVVLPKKAKYPKLGAWKCCIETWCIARLRQLPLPLPPSESTTTYLGSALRRYGRDALKSTILETRMK